jgi:hypothetical protein
MEKTHNKQCHHYWNTIDFNHDHTQPATKEERDAAFGGKGRR